MKTVVGTTPLLYFKFWETYLNASGSSNVESTKKIRKEQERETEETHAIKWNKRWKVNMYHEMTQSIVLICNKERVPETFPEAATGMCSVKTVVLKNSENFSEKYLC